MSLIDWIQTAVIVIALLGLWINWDVKRQSRP